MLNITYTMTFQDWIAAYRIGGVRFRFASFRGVLLGVCLATLAMLLVAQCNLIRTEWIRQGVVPWHLIGVATAGPALVLTFGYVIFRLMLTWNIALSEQNVTTRSKGGHLSRNWLQVTDVSKDGDYIAICSGDLAALVIPRRAFQNTKVADDFYNAAFALWHDVHNPLPAPEDATIWPPAPRPASVEKP